MDDLFIRYNYPATIIKDSWWRVTTQHIKQKKMFKKISKQYMVRPQVTSGKSQFSAFSKRQIILKKMNLQQEAI